MDTETPHALSLVADIGGTNTRVALARGTAVDTATVTRYRNADHAGLDHVLRDYLAAHGHPECAGACVAMAGPVREGRGVLTNLDWEVDRAGVAESTGARSTAVLNDLQAQGHALGFLPEEAMPTLIDGPDPTPHAARLVIGVGTGFNAVSVFDSETERLVPPSEAGHVCLPVRSEADLRLARHIEAEHGFAAVEDLLSGRGLARIHRWLADEAGDAARLTPAEVIAQRDSNPLAHEAVAIFVRVLGTVAGDLALHHLPFGGVYLVGGVSRAVAPHMAGAFAQAFRDKGRFSGFMERFAVRLIEDDYAALTGCASYLAMLEKTPR